LNRSRFDKLKALRFDKLKALRFDKLKALRFDKLKALSLPKGGTKEAKGDGEKIYAARGNFQGLRCKGGGVGAFCWGVFS
jgi:hypothetical protein